MANAVETMRTLGNALSFKTDKFDFKSDLPKACNAGNRFHGRDAAEYFAEKLSASGLPADFVDEDGGWLILGQAAPSIGFEIAVGNLNEHGEGGRPGAPEWGLWIRAFQRTK